MKRWRVDAAYCRNLIPLQPGTLVNKGKMNLEATSNSPVHSPNSIQQSCILPMLLLLGILQHSRMCFLTVLSPCPCTCSPHAVMNNQLFSSTNTKTRSAQFLPSWPNCGMHVQDIRFERRQLKERQQEDHLFEGKDKFITSAYRKKLEEDKKWMEDQQRKWVSHEPLHIYRV